MRGTPFDWIAEGARLRVFWAVTVLMLALSHVLGVMSMPLYSEAAPLGIVSFEFAGDAETAAGILRSWSVEARERAIFVQGFDHLYLLAYPFWLGLGCTLVAQRMEGRAQRVGVAFAWMVLAAGLFDVVENYALLQILFDGASDGWARVARRSAWPKFGLVALAFSYMIAGVAWLALRRRSGASN